LKLVVVELGQIAGRTVVKELEKMVHGSLRDALTWSYLRGLIRVCKVVRKMRAQCRNGICPSRTVSRCSAGVEDVGECRSGGREWSAGGVAGLLGGELPVGEPGFVVGERDDD
jgi:hypothetical protein